MAAEQVGPALALLVNARERGYDHAAQPARTSASRNAVFFAPQTPGGDDDCEPDCVQSPIIPNEGAVGHIYSKHYSGGAENAPGEATFYPDEDLYDLLWC